MSRKNFKTLAFSIFWDRFAYYGLLSVLVLYLVHLFGFPSSTTYSIYGAFVALGFSLPVLGGLIADRYLDKEHSVMVGLILLLAANVLLIFDTGYLFYFSLVMLTLGVGFIKPNCAALVDQISEISESQREKDFAYFYMFMNIGALAGIVLYGFIIDYLGWSYAFSISAVGLVLSIILFLASYSLVLSRQFLVTLVGSVILSLIIGLTLLSVSVFNILYLILILFFIIGFVSVLYKVEREIKINLLLLCLFYFFIMLFFSGSFQSASAMLLFIKQSVNTEIFGFYIPTNIFSGLYPFFVIILAPVLAKRVIKGEITPKRMARYTMTSLALCFLAFVFLFLSSDFDRSSCLAMLFIVIATLCFGLGELLIMPTIMSLTAKLMPVKLKSTMMGVLFLFISLGGYVSGFVATLFTQKTPAGTHDFSAFFIDVSFYLLAVFVLFLISTKLTRNLLIVRV